MTGEVKKAYEWALNQNYQSIAARYARVLAESIRSAVAEEKAKEPCEWCNDRTQVMSEKLMLCDTQIVKFPPLHEVKTCPFCGAEREYIIAEEYAHGAGKRWRVVCLNCMGTMDKGYCQTQWQALEAWNRRRKEIPDE